MPDTIDSLQIEINAKATKANDAIDRLVGKLDRLTTSLSKINGTNLNGLANGVQRLGNAMQAMNNVSTADFTRLATNLTRLGNVNTSALNSAASSMSHLTRAFNSLGTVSSNAQAVGDMAKNIAKLGNKSVQTAITNIPQLATAMNGLMTTLSRSPQVSQNIIQMTNALANLASQGAKVRTASNSITTGLNKTTTATKKASSGFKGLASYIGKFYATYFMAIRGIKKLWTAIGSTADYVEAFNYFTVATGKIASKWDENWQNYADENAKNYSNKFFSTLDTEFKKLSGVSYDPQTGLLSETGLKNLGYNLQEVTQYAGQLAAMMDAVGQSGETTLATSSAFVKLAGDISSLYNINYQEAASKLRSVLQGQSRAGYGFGWDTTIASLQALASELGISKAVSEMSQMEKQQLRILTILNQSKVAWGDQANTINTLANQLRLLKNNTREAGMMLGQLFVPVLNNIIPVANGAAIAIKRLLGTLASIIGVENKEITQGYNGISEDVEDITDDYEEAAKAAEEWKNQLLGFDEVNKLSDTTDTSTANGLQDTIDLTDEIIAATEEYEKVWSAAYAEMENKAEEFANRFERIFTPIETLFTHIKAGDFSAVGGDISGFATKIVTFITRALNETPWDELGKKFGDLFSGTLIGSFDLLGESSALISKAIIGVNTFLSNAINSVDWYEATTSLLDNIVKFLENLDVIKIIETVTDVMTAINSAIISVIDAMLDNPDKLFSIFGLLVLKISQALIATFSSAVETTAEAVGDIMGTLITNGLDSLIESWSNGQEIGGKLKTIFTDGVEAFKNGTFKEWYKGKIGEMISDISDIGADIYLYFKPGIDNFYGTLKDVPEWFNNKWASKITPKIYASINMAKSAGTWISDTLNPWINKVKNSITDISVKFKIGTTWQEIEKSIKNMWYKIACWINTNIIAKINSLFKITIPRNNITSFLGISGYSGNIITIPNIPAYEAGGFPEDGLFFANHNELVGQFSNGKTAVANNAQITESIKWAAYEGMLMAMSQSSNNTNVNVVLQGDADGLFKVVQNKANNYTVQNGRPAFIV